MSASLYGNEGPEHTVTLALSGKRREVWRAWLCGVCGWWSMYGVDYGPRQSVSNVRSWLLCKCELEIE